MPSIGELKYYLWYLNSELDLNIFNLPTLEGPFADLGFRDSTYSDW